MNRLTSSPVLAFIFLAAHPCFPRTGRCVGITDGDTIKVMYFGKAGKIRLYGIDCPERRQDFGTRARKFTSRMVFGKRVDVEPVELDRCGRTVAWVGVNGK